MNPTMKAIETKTVTCGTQRALDKAIEAHKAKGWEVDRVGTVPRDSKKFTYIVDLRRKT